MPRVRLGIIPTILVNDIVIIIDSNHKQWPCKITAINGTVVDAQTSNASIKFSNVKHVNNVKLELPPYWRGTTEDLGDRETV